MPSEDAIRVLEAKVAELRQMVVDGELDLKDELALLEGKLQGLKKKRYASLSDWDRVSLARHPQRPRGLQLASAVCEAFYELRGDRSIGDDPALRGGLARLGGHRVMLLFHHRGTTPEEQRTCRSGMATPQGYRKALRLMDIAQRLRLPLVTLVDTPGAYPGVESEQQNIAGAIAACIARLLRLRVPTVTAIHGEGGSGGAIALAVADWVIMLENATYSVISPEGAAAILWKDANAASEAATALAITAPRLLEMGIVDEVIAEPLGGAHTDADATADSLRDAIARSLETSAHRSLDERLSMRYKRYRHAGGSRSNANQG